MWGRFTHERRERERRQAGEQFTRGSRAARGQTGRRKVGRFEAEVPGPKEQAGWAFNRFTRKGRAAAKSGLGGLQDDPTSGNRHKGRGRILLPGEGVPKHRDKRKNRKKED